MTTERKLKKPDPVSVTAYLRDMLAVFTEGVDNHTEAQRKKEEKTVNDMYQLLLWRDPTPDERKKISPW